MSEQATTVTAHGALLLEAAAWQPRAVAHAARADALTAGWRTRKQTGQKHAIEDFLFTYYPTKPAHLRRWHPGPDVVLLGSESDLAEHAGWRWYETVDHTGNDGVHGSVDSGVGGGVRFDAAAFLAERRNTVGYVRNLMDRTLNRRANHACFGLHEWAMVYRETDTTRHPLPLRLGSTGTDNVVESHPIKCSHFDAFRFFTPEAVPRNQLQPTRETQPDLEQPGCLHAGMDLFKWATKLGPALESDIVLDAFELARDIRTLDMQASPYDVSDYGLPAVAIETPDGKAQYAAKQREFTARSQPLRARIIAACDRLLDADVPK